MENFKRKINNILQQWSNDFQENILGNTCILTAWIIQIFAFIYAAFLFIRFYLLHGAPWNNYYDYSEYINHKYNDAFYIIHISVYAIILIMLEISYCKKTEGIRKGLTILNIIILILLGVALIPYNIFSRISYFWTPEHYEQSRMILDKCILIYGWTTLIAILMPSFVLRADDYYHSAIRRWRRSAFFSVMLIPIALEEANTNDKVVLFLSPIVFIIAWLWLNSIMRACYSCNRWFALSKVQKKLVGTKEVPYIKKIRHYSPNGTYMGDTEEDAIRIKKKYAITYVCKYCGAEYQDTEYEK